MVEEISRRKSVRSFKSDPIPDEAVRALLHWRDWVHPFKDRLTIDNHIRRLPGDARLTGLFLIKAPAYLMYTSQKAPLAGVNAGFILEQISLGLSVCGVGSCYMGAARVAPEHLRSLRFEPMILMAYGVPDGPLTRDLAGFKRKPLEQICTGDTGKLHAIIESARLAPSSMNRQPWRFAVAGDAIHCYVARSGIGMMRELCDIDLGIALAHMYLAASAQGLKVEFAQRMSALDCVPRGAHYITTMCLG